MRAPHKLGELYLIGSQQLRLDVPQDIPVAGIFQLPFAHRVDDVRRVEWYSRYFALEARSWGYHRTRRETLAIMSVAHGARMGMSVLGLTVDSDELVHEIGAGRIFLGEVLKRPDLHMRTYEPPFPQLDRPSVHEESPRVTQEHQAVRALLADKRPYGRSIEDDYFEQLDSWLDGTEKYQ